MIRITNLIGPGFSASSGLAITGIWNYLMPRSSLASLHWGRIHYSFSKKQQAKHKKQEAPKVQPKSELDFIKGPEAYKKNILEVRNMQTASEANLEEQSLKSIIVTQRNYLQQSLKLQNQNLQQGKAAEPATLKSKIFASLKTEEQKNKYFLHRPIKHLQSVYLNLFALNLVGLSWLQLVQNYTWLGWFYGMITCPAACSCVGLALGYNLAFWVIRQSFYLHMPLKEINNTQINLISNRFSNILEISFLATQFAALVYIMLFPTSFPIYKAYLLLATTSYISLALNLRSICTSVNTSYRYYTANYVKLISTATLLLSLFAIYEIQFRSAETPENTFGSQTYRKRLAAMREGHIQFKNFLKAKNYKMKEGEKINPEEGQ